MQSVVCFLLLVGCGVAVGLTKEYIFNSSLLIWSDAQSYCRQYYKDLATITTMQENDQVLQSGSGSDDSWIGLSRSNNTWYWSDGEHVSILEKYWKSSYPIFGNGVYGYDCCSISFQLPGLWLNYYCNNQRSFYCYRYLILVQEEMTWDEAQEYCRTNYTGLASVTSEASLRQLKLETSQMQTDSVWTGLRFLNGMWLWMSQEALGSLVSLSSCPPLSSRCGSLDTTTNTLENRNCNDRLNFVCYWT